MSIPSGHDDTARSRSPRSPLGDASDARAVIAAVARNHQPHHQPDHQQTRPVVEAQRSLSSEGAYLTEAFARFEAIIGRGAYDYEELYEAIRRAVLGIQDDPDYGAGGNAAVAAQAQITPPPTQISPQDVTSPAAQDGRTCSSTQSIATPAARPTSDVAASATLVLSCERARLASPPRLRSDFARGADADD